MNHLADDVVTRQGGAIRQPCARQRRQDVAAILAAADPDVDQPDHRVHPSWRARPGEHNGRGSIGIAVGLAEGFCERQQAGAVLAGTDAFDISIQHLPHRDPGGQQAELVQQINQPK